MGEENKSRGHEMMVGEFPDVSITSLRVARFIIKQRGQGPVGEAHSQTENIVDREKNRSTRTHRK